MRFGFRPGLGNVAGNSGAALDVITMLQAFRVAGVPVTSGSGPWTSLADGSGLVGWFDVSDASSLTIVSTTVTAIKNKVSNVSWAAISACPYETTGLNGHPCLHPTGLTHYFKSTESAVVSVFDCPTTAKPYTLIYVVKPDSATTGTALFGVGNSGVSSASTRTWGRRTGVSQYEYLQTAPATATNSRSAGAVSTAMQICAWHSPGVGQKMKLNNAADDPSGSVDPSYTPGTGPNQAALFCRPDSVPDSSAADQFAELGIYNRELSATELTKAYDMLLAKWS